MALIDRKKQTDKVHDAFLNAYNTGDVDLIDSVCSPAFVSHHTATKEMIRGADAYKQRINDVRAGFPDFKLERIETLYDGDKSCALYRWSGTHTGEFNGIPATNKKVTVEALTMADLEDGKLRELWVFGDEMEMMRQLGVDTVAK